MTRTKQQTQISLVYLSDIEDKTTFTHVNDFAYIRDTDEFAIRVHPAVPSESGLNGVIRFANIGQFDNIDGSAGVSFVEPITFFKEEFSGGVDYIGNYLSHIGDTLLTNGGIIYTKIGDRVWDVVTPPLKDNRVVFIQKGKDHGGNMYVFKDYKFVLVKNSEQAKWEIKER